MQRFKLSTKMVSLGLVCIICVALVLTWVYFKIETMVYRYKQADLRSVTEVAFSLLGDYENRIKSGELTPEDARKKAALRIKDLRYGGQEYFWINDFGPAMIMHPFKPELDGKPTHRLDRLAIRPPRPQGRRDPSLPPRQEHRAHPSSAPLGLGPIREIRNHRPRWRHAEDDERKGANGARASGGNQDRARLSRDLLQEALTTGNPLRGPDKHGCLLTTAPALLW